MIEITKAEGYFYQYDWYWKVSIPDKCVAYFREFNEAMRFACKNAGWK